MRRMVGKVVALGAAIVVVASGVAWAAPGGLDESFGDGGIAVVSDASGDRAFLDVARDASGRYVGAGVAGSADDGGAAMLVSRFDANGHPDATFGDGGTAEGHAGGGAGAPPPPAPAGRGAR